MGDTIGRLARDALVYGVGGVLQRLMGLLLLPFFTRVLTPADYGVVALVSLLSVALGGLYSLGSGNSLGVLYFREREVGRRAAVIWSNVVLAAANGLWLTAALSFLAPLLGELLLRDRQYADLIRLSLLGLLFTTVASPFLAYLRMEGLARRYVALTLAGALLAAGLGAYLVLGRRLGVDGLVLAGTVAQGVTALASWVAVGRRLRFAVDPTVVRALVRIGFPSVFGLLAFLVIDYADRQMIERLVGLEALGVYAVGYGFGMVMTVATGAFAAAWPAFFAAYVHRRDEARVVFARVLTYYVIGFGVLVVLFFFAARPLVLLLTAPPFHDGALVVGLVAAAYMLKGCYLITLPGLCFAGKLHLQAAIEWSAALVNIGLNLLLIPAWGIVGAAVATFIAYLCLPPLTWLAARHYLAVDYQWHRLWPAALAVTTASAGMVWSSTAVGGVWLALFLLVAYRFLLTPGERALLWGGKRG